MLCRGNSAALMSPLFASLFRIAMVRKKQFKYDQTGFHVHLKTSRVWGVKSFWFTNSMPVGCKNKVELVTFFSVLMKLTTTLPDCKHLCSSELCKFNNCSIIQTLCLWQRETLNFSIEKATNTLPLPTNCVSQKSPFRQSHSILPSH